MKKILIAVFLLVPMVCFACPEAIYYAYPCGKPDLTSEKVSVYQSDSDCVQTLLYDGVCPDYLAGNCASRHNCNELAILINSKKPVLFSD
jgi:homoserine trans-succinylase